MREAVIVSYARTGLAKAARGGFNNTSNMTMLGAAIEQAVARSKAAPAEIEDVVAGCVAASGNVGRAAALLAGLPVTTSGVTVNRAPALPVSTPSPMRRATLSMTARTSSSVAAWIPSPTRAVAVAGAIRT